LSQTILYASVLPKIGAERSKLLSETKLKSLTESRDLSTFTAQLRETSYQTQLAKMPMPLTSRKLERAFNENLIETYEKIIKNSPKKAIKYLNLHLLRFEVENIKALIKATNGKLSPEVESMLDGAGLVGTDGTDGGIAMWARQMASYA